MHQIASKKALTTKSLSRHMAKHLHQIGSPVTEATAKALEERALEDREKILDVAVGIKLNRLRRHQELQDALRVIQLSRAKAYADAPGGKSGFIVTRQRSLRTGDKQYKVIDEHEFDFNQMRAEVALTETVAKEVGGMFENRPHPGQIAGGSTSGTVVIVVPGNSRLKMSGQASAVPATMGMRGRLPSQTPVPPVLDSLGLLDEEPTVVLEVESSTDSAHYQDSIPGPIDVRVERVADETQREEPGAPAESPSKGVRPLFGWGPPSSP